MKELIKRRKMDNIVLDIVIFIVMIMTIIMSINDYKELFIEENIITDYNSYNSFKDNKKYVSIDLSNAKITHLSLENKSTNEKEINVYKLTFGNDTLLIFLNSNTALTDKVDGKLIKPSGSEEEVRKVISKELTTNILDDVFTNVNYEKEKNIIKLRVEMCFIIIILSIFSFMINIVGYINPEKTKKYKKYLEKEKLAEVKN